MIRVARLEERFNAMAEDVREIKDDLRYLREHLVDKSDFRNLQQRVNGLTLKTAQMSGKISVLLMWLAQGGTIGAVVLGILKVAKISGFV